MFEENQNSEQSAMLASESEAPKRTVSFVAAVIAIAVVGVIAVGAVLYYAKPQEVDTDTELEQQGATLEGLGEELERANPDELDAELSEVESLVL